jgi:hypothetical protein
MPFVEAGSRYDALNMLVDQDFQAVNVTALAQRIPVLLCPSDVRAASNRVQNARTNYGNLNYLANRGVWFAWDAFATGRRPQGMFMVNDGVRPRDVIDGLSKTCMFSEGKVRRSFIRGCTTLVFQPNGPLPEPGAGAAPTDIPQYFDCAGGDIRPENSHTEWHTGEVHHSGFTFAYTPNRLSPGRAAGVEVPDTDLVSVPELDGGPTYAAVTARSYHPGGVNVVLADATVHFVSDSIDANIWRALGTVDGQETANF